jgi:lysozyme
MRAIPQLATDFVAEHEALKLASYLDSAGCYTIGFGHVGPEVHAGLRWSEDKCRAALAEDLKVARSRLYAKIKREVIEGDLTDHQWAALLSFAFNLGTPGTTLWQRLNARQFDQVPAELVRFCYVTDPKTKAKVKLQGLVNRRAAEVALWATAEPGSVPDDPPSSFTRAEDTPPAAADPVPVHKQPAMLATASAAVLGAPAAIKTVADQVSPYAATSHYVASVVEWLATAGAGAAVAAGLVLYLQHRAAKR